MAKQKKKIYHRTVFHAAALAPVDPRWFSLEKVGPFAEFETPNNLFAGAKNEFITVKMMQPYLYSEPMDISFIPGSKSIKDLVRFRITVDEIPYDYPHEPDSVSYTDPMSDEDIITTPLPSSNSQSQQQTKESQPKVKRSQEDLVFTPTASSNQR